MSTYIQYPNSSGKVPVYASAAAFPASGNTIGDLAIAADTGAVYEWRGSSWVALADPAISPLAITALTGDVTASGPGAVAATLATVNGSPGSFGSASQSLSATVNGKGLVTSLSAQSIQIAESQVTNLVSDLAAKVPSSSLGNLTDVGTDGITVTGGTGAVVGNVSLSQQVADTSHNGYLSSTDWNTFNGKTSGGITALTGDGTASGPGSAALTLATVNGSPGSFGSASSSLSATVNGKGLVTSLSSQSIQIAESQVTNLVSDLAGKVATSSLGNLTDAGTDGITVTGGTGAVVGSVALAQHVADTTHNGYLSSTDWNTFNGKGSGTVTAVSVASSNGFTGSSSAGATPALTLATSVTGIIKGNGTALSAATTTAHNVLIGAGAADFTNVAPSATSGVALVSAGASSDPIFGTVAIAGGGTGEITANAALNALLPTQTSNNGKVLQTDGSNTSWASTSTGTVTSVTFTGDGTVLSSTPSSAVTTSGTVTASLNTQAKNTFLSGPTTGSNAAPTFRVVNSADLPTAAFVAPTIQTFTSSSGTYSTPTSPRAPVYIKVRMVGGGGGGAGSGSAAGTAATDGGNTTFGTTLLVANGGTHGTLGSTGGSGGTASLGSGPIGVAIAGQAGGGSTSQATNPLTAVAGPSGGMASFYGGGGHSQRWAGTGQAGIANTGGGGQGGGADNTTNLSSGSGGGAGGFVEAIITSPSASYAYAVGAGGSGGAAGTSGAAGGAGGSGYIEVWEFYQ